MRNRQTSTMFELLQKKTMMFETSNKLVGWSNWSERNELVDNGEDFEKMNSLTTDQRNRSERWT